MTSLPGLMKAYWLSERWKEAWTLTIAAGLLTMAASKSGVWVAEASGSFVGAIAGYHDGPKAVPRQDILDAGLLLVAFALMKTVVFLGLRHYVLTTLHRLWRRWLDDCFNEALLDNRRAYFHLLSNGQATTSGEPLPDNIDQRLQESIKVMTGGALGLAAGLFGVVTSVYFVGEAILFRSTAVEGLEFLGRYGTLVLVLLLVAIYVPACTWMALRIGRWIERLNAEMQRTEGTYRSELSMLTRRALQVAASDGEYVQRRIHGQHYRAIDANWIRQNKVAAVFLAFNQFYGFLTQRVVAYLPNLPAFLQGSINFRGFVTGSELVTELINDCSWLIQVMPDVAALKANAGRVAELARAIERVRESRAFYRESGVSEFAFEMQAPEAGFTVDGLELMHRGRASVPFVKIDGLRLEPGQWVFVSGLSGCGKSSLVKAMNGLWPYGRGRIGSPRGSRRFYACQDLRLPQTSLRQLVTLPDSEAAYRDIDVAAVLGKVGLGEFIAHLAEPAYHGRRWDEILSGGQKQKLILARILLQRPTLIFLDEATSALDGPARVEFHRLIREACPQAIVVSVMHDADPPIAEDGSSFYSGVLHIDDARATLRQIPVRPAIVPLRSLAPARPVLPPRVAARRMPS